MPELPEVEHGRRVAHAVAVGRRIVAVRCARDLIVFDGQSAATMKRALVERRVTGTDRHGKYLWLELDERPWPVMHFGMTGGLRVRDREPLVLASSPKEPDRTWPPRFWKLHLVFDDGGELVMTDARRLGRVRLRREPRAEPPVSRLGFDPLLAMPDLPTFRRLFGERRSVLKALLLDQTFAAGVGNWIADEVLYQARLDPRRRTDGLWPAEVARLHRALGRVIRTAVRADARSDRFPKGWLFHRRWGRDPDARTVDGERIVHITVAGRTTAWVPAVQG